MAEELKAIGAGLGVLFILYLFWIYFSAIFSCFDDDEYWEEDFANFQDEEDEEDTHS